MPTSPYSTNIKPNESQFVSDLANLFRRHRVRCGDPGDLEHLASELETNDHLCGDLFLLCTAISHMGEEDLSPEQMLTLIAQAVGGPRAFADKGREIPSATRFAFLSRYAQWSSRFAGPVPPAAELPGDAKAHEATRQPAELPYLRAAALSAKPGSQAGDRTRTGRVSPETGVGDLTLRELSEYLMDLERRVKRAEAYLDAPESVELPSAEERDRVPGEPEMPKPDTGAAPLAAEENASTPSYSPNVFVPPPRGTPYFARRPVEASRDVAPAPSEAEHDVQPQWDRVALPAEAFAAPELFAAGTSSPATAESGRRPGRAQGLWITTATCLCIAGGAVLGYLYYERTASDPGSLDGSPAVSSQMAQQASGSQKHPDVPSTGGRRTGARSTAAGGRSTVQSASEPTPAHRDPVARADSAMTSQEPAAQAEPVSVLHNLNQSLHEIAQVATPEVQPVQLARAAPDMPTPAAPRQIIEPYNQRGNSEPEATPTRSSARTSPVAPREEVARTAPISSRATVSPSPPRVVSVSSTALMSYALASPRPRYPMGRHIDKDTSVLVRATISKDGRVTSAKALSGADDLRGAAEVAMYQWRFRPYMVDGIPAEVVTAVTFVFKAQ